MLKRRLALFVAAAALAAPVGGTAQADPTPPSAVVAKSCSAGYRHAVIGGRHKCLRRGQYCAKRYDRRYHRYGYHCHTGRLR